MRCHAILESLRVLCIARQPGLAVAGIERGIVDRLRPWVTVGPDVVVIHLVEKRRRQRRRQRYQSECGGKDEFFHRRSPLPIRSPRAEKGFWGLPKFKGRNGGGGGLSALRQATPPKGTSIRIMFLICSMHVERVRRRGAKHEFTAKSHQPAGALPQAGLDRARARSGSRSLSVLSAVSAR